MKNNVAKVIVGMSGGVDSSVAASLLKSAGHEVIGVSLNFLSCDHPIERSCCSAKDRMDALSVCKEIGIEHKVVDLRIDFRDSVIRNFISEYLAGRTPSPCILCNHLLKFPALIREADKVGARYIATGHYARTVENGDKTLLKKGMDEEKDQSYFLFGLNQEILNRTIFPLGELYKTDVRQIAKKIGLKTEAKPDSQEVCFVPQDDYVAFIEARASDRIKGPGNFVDAKGNVIGRHKGIHAYTIGQRRGLGFGIGRRQYVVRIDADKNEVVLGGEEDLTKKWLVVANPNWISGSASKAVGIVKIRSTHKGERGRITLIEEGKARVDFPSPVRAIAPGQAAVFYDGETVLGGGWIE